MLQETIRFDHQPSDVSVDIVTLCFIIACLGRVEARLHIGAGLISRSPNGNATVWRVQNTANRGRPDWTFE